MEKIYATGVEKFAAAIREFGVDLALEYFSTPEELHHLWDEERQIEKAEKNIK